MELPRTDGSAADGYEAKRKIAPGVDVIEKGFRKSVFKRQWRWYHWKKLQCARLGSEL
jgi:hypothetical protein